MGKSIKENLKKIKNYYKFHKEEVFGSFIIILVSLSSFFLGRISENWSSKSPFVLDREGQELSASDIALDKLETYDSSKKEEMETVSLENNRDKNTQVAGTGYIVASKNGTRYYFSWCSGVSRISPKNLVSFNSEEEARARGLLPAANCPGLK